MSDRLKGKRAFVTAGAAGIGRAWRSPLRAKAPRCSPPTSTKKASPRLRRKALPKWRGSTCATRAAVNGNGQTRRQGRYPAQCRRLRASRHRARMLGRGLGFFLRPQRQIDAPHDPGVPAGHAGKRRRLDRQHLLGRRRVQGRAQPLRLRRDQGRGRSPDPRGRGRFHHQGHSLQLHLPRHHRDAVDAGPRRGRGPARAARCSSAASRWAGSAPRRKSPRSRSTSPATRAPSPPASPTSSTAAGRCKRQERTHPMNKIDLNGRCAVVTGGAQGFGPRHHRALRRFRRQGRDLGS